MRIVLVLIMTLWTLFVQSQNDIYQLQPWPADSTYVLGAWPDGEPKWISKSTISTPDSIYVKTATAPNPDTIYLRDGSGFVLMPKGNSGTVTSVGLTTGTTGTDVNVTGSPITTSGTFNLNIPTASATNRGALSSADWTTFNGKVGGTGVADKVAIFNSNNTITHNNLFHINSGLGGPHLGIGTSSPSVGARVHIADGDLFIIGGSNRRFLMGSSVSLGFWGGMKWNPSNNLEYIHSGYSEVFPVMLTTSLGYTGIRTQGVLPTTPLDVFSSNTSDNGTYQNWAYSAAPTSYRLLLKQTVTGGNVRYNFSQINAGTDYENVLVFDRGNLGIGITDATRKVDINGEVRIRDLTTTTPALLVSADANGVLSSTTIGTGLSLTSGVLSTTITNTDNQTLSFIAPNLSISGGNSVDISAINTDNQNLSHTVSGTDRTINISGGTGTTISVADNDNDSTNELQTISKSGSTVTLSNGGGSFNDDVGPTYTAGTGIDLAGNVISNTGDLSNTNELNTGVTVVHAAGNVLPRVRVTDGGGTLEGLVPFFSTSNLNAGVVTGSNGVANTNFLSADGQWRIPTGNTYTAGSGLSLTGNTFANTRSLSKSGNTVSLSNGGSSFDISNTAPSINNFLQWNGTNWVSGTAMINWNIGINNGSYTTVGNNNNVTINAGTNISLSKSGGAITVNSTGGSNWFLDNSVVYNFGASASTLNSGRATRLGQLQGGLTNQRFFDVNGDVKFRSAIYDKNDSRGSNGQVLTSNGTDWTWQTPSAGSTQNLSYGTKSGNRIPLDITSGVGVNIDQGNGIIIDRTASNVITVNNSMIYSELTDATSFPSFTYDGTVRIVDFSVGKSNGNISHNATTDRITVNLAGTYEVTYGLSYNIPNTPYTTTPRFYVRINNSQILAASQTYPRNSDNSVDNFTTVSRTATLNLAANDYVDLVYVRYLGTTNSIIIQNPILTIKRLY